MFFPGTPKIFLPGDSVFMLFKCMCNNISIEKKHSNIVNLRLVTASNGLVDLLSPKFFVKEPSYGRR